MTQIQLRRDTETNWQTANPILADGEIGIATTTNKFKIGNGASDWNSLTYANEPYNLPSATTSVLGGVKSDGSTITIDSDGTIRTTTTFWKGTQTAYDAIETKDPNTVYLITAES